MQNLFNNLDPEARRRRLRLIAIVGGVILLVTVVIIGLAVGLKSKKQPPSLPDNPQELIECPGLENSKDCTDHGCDYYEANGNGPKCVMPKNKFGYTVHEHEDRENGIIAHMNSKSSETPYGKSITNVSFDVEFITENILRVKFLDRLEKQYEVPAQKVFPLLAHRPSSVDYKKLKYKVEIADPGKDFFYKVTRDDGTVLWDTSIGGLMMSHQFLQIASFLPSKYVYGLGEHTRQHLRHDLNYVTWPMFSRDRTPERGQANLYGVHPFYTCLENSGKSHGVLLLNSNAMEATLMPAPGISFRTIGGVLDLFYFVGDNPEHVVQLYTSLIGRPMIPPYWGLGFQLSRYGYDNIQNVKDVVKRTRDAMIPQDVQYLDIDHMDGNKDFTINKENFTGLIEFVKKTKEENGLKWIIIVDPAIAALKGYEIYESGLEKHVFIRRAPWWNGKSENMFPPDLADNVTYGKVWPKEPVAFPDFFLEETHEWWTKCFSDYHKNVIPFDGVWIDMNEPSNFGTNGEDYDFCEWTNVPKDKCWVLKCPKSAYEEPPYNPLKTTGSPKLSSKTLCMESLQGKHPDFIHYDVHSLYGWSQAVATLSAAQAATKTRSLIISRSTYPSSGKYTGHWLGDNKSRWTDLHDSIIGMLEFNLFGIPYIGADVCGFDLDTTSELCGRWMQLGAFYPFFRNHNGKGWINQDPVAMGDDVVKKSKNAIYRRYSLNPYLYTLFYKAHINGNTVIRPLFHEFPTDKTTWDIDEQFMWGSSILVSPLLKQGEKKVNAYLPEGEWWEFQYENSIQETVSKQIVTKDAEDYTPMHVRGGSIIPIEKDIRLRAPTKDESRNISLYVFPKDKLASGELFLDDGLSVDSLDKKQFFFFEFKLKDCELTFTLPKENFLPGTVPNLKQVIVFKVPKADTVKINNDPVTTFQLNKEKQILTIDVNQDLITTTISWKNSANQCEM